MRVARFKKPFIAAVLIAAVVLLFRLPKEHIASPSLSSLNVSPGDTLVVSLAKPDIIATSTFDGKALSFFTYGGGLRALVPILFSAKPGVHVLSVEFMDGRSYQERISIYARKFPVITLGVPADLNESPGQVVQNFADIKSELADISQSSAPRVFFKQGFRMPLEKTAELGSQFGELRRTGGYTVRHLGTDLVAPTGTPVLAVNDGIVRLAASLGDYGNTIIIDHGASILSLYLHLQEIRIKAGQAVRKGEVIGTVGQTGYAFAPHLHLSIKINGVSVDPVRFIQTFK